MLLCSLSVDAPTRGTVMSLYDANLWFSKVIISVPSVYRLSQQYDMMLCVTQPCHVSIIVMANCHKPAVSKWKALQFPAYLIRFTVPKGTSVSYLD